MGRGGGIDNLYDVTDVVCFVHQKSNSAVSEGYWTLIISLLVLGEWDDVQQEAQWS